MFLLSHLFAAALRNFNKYENSSTPSYDKKNQLLSVVCEFSLRLEMNILQSLGKKANGNVFYYEVSGRIFLPIFCDILTIKPSITYDTIFTILPQNV